MKTLFIGDTHLQLGVLKRHIIRIVKEKDIDEVVFLGDYFDQWKQNLNVGLYEREIKELKGMKELLTSLNVKSIFLLGNHDLPYITGFLDEYSIHIKDVVNKIKDLLINDLRCQLVYKVDHIVVSHAGFTDDSKYLLFIDGWLSKPLIENLSRETLYTLAEIQAEGGYRMGGNTHGSFVWSDFGKELVPYRNKKIEAQIVGHTPVKKVSNNGKLYNVDTLSLTPRLAQEGDLSVLIKDNEEMIVLPLVEDLTEYRKKIPLYFSGELSY